MASWLNKVEASMDTVVDQLLSVHAVFLLKVGIEACLDIFDDGLPAVPRPEILAALSSEMETI